MNILTVFILILSLFISISFANDGYEGYNCNDGATRVCPIDCSVPIGLIEHNNKKYLFETNMKLSWMEAFQMCMNYKLRLLTLESDEEYKFINRAISFTMFWTSGNNLADDSKFIWETTKNELNLTAWNKTALSYDRRIINANPHCIVAGYRNFEKKNLQPIPCTNKNNFICEKY